MISISGVSNEPDDHNSEALTCENFVSEGGLEPVAYILAACGEPWLSV
jgi:hypothetical protein